jgi:hypothetical protein
LERRLSALAIAIALVGFGTLLIALPPFFQSFDEAKYVGIGRNVLAGRGVVTIDGTPFLEHSPLWSVAIVAPALALGGSPLDWGRALDVVAGLAFVALVGAFGWRVRPAVGALAAAVVVGFVYLHDLTRTARLDVPAATLTLAAVAAGLRAFERRSTGWAVGAGVLFGLAGLVKEIVAPFLPVPILAAILRGVAGRSIVRLSGAMALAGLATTAWWFVVVAEYTGRVYRLGLPAWTLGPLGAALVAASVAAVGIERLATLPALGRRLGAAGAGPGDGLARRVGRRGRILIVGAAALAWCGLQLLFYAHSRDARLPNLVNFGQLRVYAATWAPALGLVGGFVAGGGAIVVGRFGLERWASTRRSAVGDRVGVPGPTGAAEWVAAEPVAAGRLPRAERLAIAELAVALVCGAPLVLLVASLGEPPRNYLAQIGLAVAFAAAGWIWLAESLAARGARAWLAAGAGTGLAAGFALVAIRVPPALALGAGAAGGMLTGAATYRLHRGLPIVRRGWPVVAALAAAVVFVGTLGVYAVGHRESAGGRARAEVVASVVGWVRDHVAPGSTVALGSLLGYEIGNELVGDYGVARITQTSARVDPRAPLGVAPPAGATIDDWIALDPAPRNTTEFAAFRATTILDRLRRTGAAVWVYVIGTDTAAPTILAALTPDHGFREVARFVAPTSSGAPPIEAIVFRIDPDRLALPADRLYIAPAALERLVAGLGAADPPPREVAARLLERLVVVPERGARPWLERLRAIAAGSP